MFGIGMPEMLLVFAIALIVVGPKKIPDLAKALGRGFAEFRKATQEIKDQLELDSTIHEINDTIKDTKKEILSASKPQQYSPSPSPEANNDEKTPDGDPQKNA